MKRALEYIVKPVFKALDDTAAHHPNEVGFIDVESGDFTYGMIKKATDLLLGALMAEGLHKGDRVLVVMPNSIEFVVSYYGIQKAGGVVVPVNTLHTDEEIKKYMNIVEPRGVLTTPELYNDLSCLQELEGFKWVFPLDGQSLFD